ncbi:AAA family ATPase [Schaedlerella arabinosiphila]|uniref:AAA family ATPase n=1 Tax=Schaedlerella arabinosiphila TaxID=2044587 RepID=UPI002557D01D|nr:AAA family ATPase [Schaedlerella arabinosiphila]
MGIYLNPGNENFKSALRSEIYVDKSLLLKYTNSVVDTEQRCLCVSRPRRFGKSITADMLAAYYGKDCDSSGMFAELKISTDKSYKEHLNQYHVIHVDMNTFCHKRDAATRLEITASQAVDLFHMEVIKELRKQFGECVKEDAADLPTVLADVNDVLGEKFVIIIDEWDTIFRENKLDTKAQDAYIDLLRGLFKNATSKKFLKLAYITGILPVKKYGTESALNNFDEFTMIQADPLEKYVGFTENEVRELYQKYEMSFEEAKGWYDGYVLGDHVHIYNPKSVVDSLRRKRISNYWTSTETYESLKTYIGMNYEGLKDAVVSMISGGRIRIDTGTFENDMVHFASRDDVLTVLIHLGYLAYEAEQGEVYIPNEEVRSAFVRAVKKNKWDKVIQAIEASDMLLKATWSQDEQAVARAVEKVHMDHTSILQYNDENALSCVISLAYYNAVDEYTLIRELPAGKGYADVVFLPRRNSEKPAMIVELKCGKSTRTALDQIRERRYAEALEEYKGNLLLVGINYEKESKEHQCEIEKIVW